MVFLASSLSRVFTHRVHQARIWLIVGINRDSTVLLESTHLLSSSHDHATNAADHVATEKENQIQPPLLKDRTSSQHTIVSVVANFVIGIVTRFPILGVISIITFDEATSLTIVIALTGIITLIQVTSVILVVAIIVRV